MMTVIEIKFHAWQLQLNVVTNTRIQTILLKYDETKPSTSRSQQWVQPNRTLTTKWKFLFLALSSFIYQLPGALSSSSILGNLDSTYFGKLNSYLDPVLQSPGRSRFVRCWRAKTDGWAASTFHSNCDGKGPTVTIVQVGSYIFGGYTDKSWSNPSKYQLHIWWIHSGKVLGWYELVPKHHLCANKAVSVFRGLEKKIHIRWVQTHIFFQTRR